MKKLLALFLALLLPASARAQVFVNQAAPKGWEERALMRLTAFQTGESDCMLLECGGKSMMIDGGADPYREKLRGWLNEREISHFEYLFSTHPHDDHIDGLWRLMKYGFTADAFVSPFEEGLSYKLHARAVRQARSSNIPYRQVLDGDVLSLGEGRLTVYRWDEGRTLNGMSATLLVQYGEARLLLCADAIGLTQKHFLTNPGPAALKADIVKVPHHGLTPMVSAFADAVAPELLLITNTQKKGTKGIIDQARYRGLPYLFTGKGTVVMETDGADWYVWQEKP